jgi:hypothetical protein
MNGYEALCHCSNPPFIATFRCKLDLSDIFVNGYMDSNDSTILDNKLFSDTQKEILIKLRQYWTSTSFISKGKLNQMVFYICL